MTGSSNDGVDTTPHLGGGRHGSVPGPLQDR
jgi:hypothetical protein